MFHYTHIFSANYLRPGTHSSIFGDFFTLSESSWRVPCLQIPICLHAPHLRAPCPEACHKPCRGVEVFAEAKKGLICSVQLEDRLRRLLDLVLPHALCGHGDQTHLPFSGPQFCYMQSNESHVIGWGGDIMSLKIFGKVSNVVQNTFKYYQDPFKVWSSALYWSSEN